jgi:hypothetical protein
MDRLADLRPYHLPDPISWWPPAPGWWLLAFVLIGLVAAAAYFALRWHRRCAPARAALRELSHLRATPPGAIAAPAFAASVFQILRRFAIVRFSARDVAGLTGAAWLVFLDEHGGGEFRNSFGGDLADLPYRRSGSVDRARLVEVASAWIRRNASFVMESEAL